ncbi:MAG: hypothetical protein MUC87_18300 [Bacteroidia bacterium]|jgi:hypothetical protein|nr:hypothetical protein [Bacteroidia bacterium]
MLRRLLFQHRQTGTLIVAITGAFIGMFLLLAALQLYSDVSKIFGSGQNLNGTQYLVINKKVNLLNTLFGGKKGFEQADLAALKAIEGVQNAAPLTTSRFKVTVSTEDGQQGLPGMYSQIFFEAVPDGFMDVKTSDWRWKEGDREVPIIIPRDYIRLYNFGFAPTQGLPQLTEEVLGLFSVNVNVSGPKGSATFKGRLVGFSDRINSILAPQGFIDYANATYSGIAPGSEVPSRVIVACEGRGMGKLAAYFADNGYETNAENLRSGRLQAALNVLMTIISAIGILIVLLALLSFLLYAQLMLSKSSWELQTLIRIGYTPAQLCKRYILFYALVYAGVLVLALLCVWLGKPLLGNYLASQSPDLQLEGGMSLNVVLAGFACAAVFTGANLLAIWRGLVKLARS